MKIKSILTIVITILMSLFVFACGGSSGGGGGSNPPTPTPTGTPDPNNPQITSYSIATLSGLVVSGSINQTQKTIALYFPKGSSLESLVATFSATGTLTIGSTPQVSGVTVNNFTSPLTYTVTSSNQTKVSYTITATAQSNAAFIPASTWRMQCIVGTSFSNIKSTVKNCDGANLANLNLQGAVQGNIFAPQVDLTGSSFNGAHLENAILNNDIINHTTFDGANLSGATLGGYPTTNISFANATLNGTVFIGGTSFSTADFSGATVSNMGFPAGTTFANMNFNNATLSGFSLAGGSTNFNTLSNSTFIGTAMPTGDSFAYMNINSCNFQPSSLPTSGISFANSIIGAGTIFNVVNVAAPHSVSFANAQLTGVSFQNIANALGWTFGGAIITGNTTFQISGSANGFNFMSSVLSGVTFHFTTPNPAISGWNLTGATFNNVTFNPKPACTGVVAGPLCNQVCSNTATPGACI